MIKVRVIVDKNRCSLCGICARLCPTKVFRVQANSISVDENRCIACFGCTKLCPQKAIDLQISNYSILDYKPPL